MNRSHGFLTALTLGLLGPLFSLAVSAEERDPRTVEELFARSAAAYRALPSLEIVMNTTAEIPRSKPGQRAIRYLLGESCEAVFEIESRMRVVVTKDRIFTQYVGHEDRVLSLSHDCDLAGALAAVRGKSAFAGLWEPPQSALRSGRALEGIVDAFRYSSLLGKLSVTDFTPLSGRVYEVRMEADNGSCTARFDGSTFFVEEIEYLVQPPGGPDGYAMRMSCRISTRQIPYDSTLFAFDVEDNTVVEEFRELAPPAPGIARPPEEVLQPATLASRTLNIEGLAAAVQDRRVLLIGEDHLYEEPPEYAIALLEELGGPPVSLLLEMPADTQENINRYLKQGDERILDEIFTGKPVLRLQQLLRWARANQKYVRTVKAFDEPMYEIRLKRSHLADTRNETMAAALHREWQAHPDRRIVAYAGQLHMMKAGRYRVDQPSRQTAGARTFTYTQCVLNRARCPSTGIRFGYPSPTSSIIRSSASSMPTRPSTFSST
ncbi:MAG: hypothetical protein P8127_02480 [Acidobacteriota bacterium]